MRLLLVLPVALSLACSDKSSSADDTATGVQDLDADGDGHDALQAGGDDCDDADASVYPGAIDEWYDGVDSDCDGADDFDADYDGYSSNLASGGDDCDDTNAGINPGVEETWYDGVDVDCDGNDCDADEDGYDASEGACDPPSESSDCDDGDSSRHPGATEVWYDGIDQDCAGDDDCDADGDGFRSAGDGCVGNDCDDGDATIRPGADETWYDGVDSDCDDGSDFDADGDGYDVDTLGGDDCDDADADVSPGATDLCEDGIDQDCDGTDPECRAELTVDELDLDDADYVIAGDTSSDYAARQPLVVGDVTGDGVADLIIGSNAHSSSAGATWVFAGPISGDLSSSDAIARLDGEDRPDEFGGYAQTGGEDVDGDGINDLFIGAWKAGSSTQGGAYLFLGPITAVIDAADADAKLFGETSGDYAGRAVAMLGDTDGDGEHDYLVGARQDDDAGTNAGAGYVVLGPISGSGSLGDHTKLTGESAGDIAGGTVCALGDHDGDGLGDFGLSSSDADPGGRDEGIVYVFWGPVTSDASVSTADVSIEGSVADGSLAYCEGAGDVDGDGYDDLLIGGGAYSGTGSAFLLAGPVSASGEVETLATAAMAPDDSGDLLVMRGSSGTAEGFGDINGDGLQDLGLGSRADDTAGTDAGAAWVVLGPASGTIALESDADVKFWGVDAGDWAGLSVGGGGDIDGDGVDDILIGAYYADDGATNGGAVYIVSGYSLW